MIIAFVGAGGKTSCMLEWARALSKEGKKVLVTTTTHLEHPDRIGEKGVVDGTKEEICRALKERGWILCGSSCEHPDKIKGLSQNLWQQVIPQADVVLVEADGSKRFPIKVPKQGEPVIPKGCDHIVVVAGAKALGRPWREACFRQEQAEMLLQGEDTILTAEMLGILLREGYEKPLKKQYPKANITILLNQAEVLEQPEETRACLQQQLSSTVRLHGWNKELHAIYLAAGFSRRFQGNKLLSQVAGRPMYQHVLERLEELQQEQILQSVTVVTQYEEILEQLRDHKVWAVKNENSILGISSSLKTGIQEAQKHQKNPSKKEHAYLFSVADQPFLQKETLREFISAFWKSRKGIGCLSFHGKMGNPVIFREAYLPELMALEGDTGGKKVLKRHLEDVFSFEIQKEQELSDIDERRVVKK